MTRITTLGEAIRYHRKRYGIDVANVHNRAILSATDLYQYCQEQDGGEEHFPPRASPRTVIEGWELGRRSPTPAQCRLMEIVLKLDPLELDCYATKGAITKRQSKGKSEPAPQPDDERGADPIETMASAPGPTSAPIEDAQGAAQPEEAALSADPLRDLGGIDTAIAAGVGAAPNLGRRFALPYDSDREDADIKQLRRALPANRRLTVVTGQPFLGKKAKIKGMLRLIAEKSDVLTYDLASEDGSITKLPIFAWSARRLHYRELVERVHDFLSAYRAAVEGRPLERVYPTPEPTLPMPEPDRALDGLIEQINQNFTDLPAIFIFVDVDAFGANHARNVVRDLGIEQLIRTLLDANKQSRIVITTSDFEGRSSQNPQMVNFPQHQTIRIEEPHFWEVGNFIRPDIREAPYLVALCDCDVRVRGDDLVALGALINLTYDEEVGKLPEEAVGALDRFVESTPQERDAARNEIYRLIIDAICEEGLIHPVALVAASEDGVRPDSLRYLLFRWRQQNGDVAAFDDNQAVDYTLAEFAGRVGTRFLRRTGIPRYDAEEYDFDEEHHESDLVWEMDPIISMYFLDALRTFERTLPAYAHRLIALIARLRSQQKKVQMRSPIGSRASEEVSRDVQSYVNLLASILFEDDDAMSLDGPPLRLSESEVFAIDGRFNAARALRFAVFCLLKEDIDRDHRLTMIFDEDALRLDLFLLLFQELGRVYTPEVKMLDLPLALPDHLTSGIFSVEEVLDVMSTVALSAYHAQRSTIVDDITDMAAEFATKHGIALSSIQLSRLWCCKIDASLRRGYWTGPRLVTEGQAGGPRPEAADGHLATLKFVRDSRRAWYPDLADNVPTGAIDCDELSRHKAHLRLLIREADLATLVYAKRSDATALYNLVEQIEAILARSPKQDDPVVLSGRAGRRYIQFLLKDPAILQPTNDNKAIRDALFDKVEALLSVNKSRLRRFSGADRVGVMLDIARLKMVRGDLASAHHFAEAAKRRAFSGSVSHGGKLDVFQVLAKVKLSLVETGNVALYPKKQDAARLMKDAEIAIRNLRAIAEHLSYTPSIGMAHMLDARLELVRDARRRRRSGAQTDNHLRCAREAIDAARDALGGIRQVNLNETLDVMDAEVRNRRMAKTA